MISNPLIQKAPYVATYTSSLLCPIPRKMNREKIGINFPLPFQGRDVWHADEISWLNKKGKPHFKTATILFPIDNDFLIESKSLKLYFNSFNQSAFENEKAVMDCIERDLSSATQSRVTVMLNDNKVNDATPEGFCLDDQDIACEHYFPAPDLLTVTPGSMITETLYSRLLKSNCPVTHQPDWATIGITYTGPKISRDGLLRYLVSFRQHAEFHEHCIETIFVDILKRCACTQLTIRASYTRRGGIAIHPERYTNKLLAV
ncbi:MAG: 7-cyano-7-deazaguanine reductase [uncultured bacterium]|nr:MAG: 7-cyano-7-deazaguanine reductase [uncultured bacterium]OGT26256.1 MAG: NADPH-dependent 7-cyano-7-deazaguanine reductase QueF [Gammaproteobacteria bacterium RIFCSPHIGHO2_02_FULL_42_43]OGT29238.1 MAG: NADPH-dependent 7-cyano-7-deazaguanine reductase QueF [Gammaproteobacteria bacterium RIFCSPHIGHO2_01_FULL_42_8]OGT52633.1 MAG: NADPH-dependent 7-cyano-7-deazaguanine reductase QueF [Gammaproteobacteria bacterium RIFCSPHIGHO2_12_FULL_41_25]OGT63231.1 MAG: NADPH-dependent 7-cyano-7-deazaguanin